MNLALMQKITDLLKQATTEQSHFYVAATLADCANELVKLYARTAVLEGRLEQLQDENMALKRTRPGKS